MDHIMKKLILLLIAIFAFYQYIFYIPSSTNSTYPEHQTPSSSIAAEINKKDKVDSNTFSNNTIGEAFTNRSSNIHVQGIGTVIKILKDDLKGSQHQRFIIRLSTGHTLLIAHNIDLAPRINSIGRGDSIEFYGEYEWNSKGGVIHWTHHDPRGQHKGGWIKHNGRTYQ
jgi:hypothetical protein